jgi:hypothetical protein
LPCTTGINGTCRNYFITKTSQKRAIAFKRT